MLEYSLAKFVGGCDIVSTRYSREYLERSGARILNWLFVPNSQRGPPGYNVRERLINKASAVD